MLSRWFAPLAVAVVCFAMFASLGCNTVRGVGKDVEAGGKAIQRSTQK